MAGAVITIGASYNYIELHGGDPKRYKQFLYIFYYCFRCFFSPQTIYIFNKSSTFDDKF